MSNHTSLITTAEPTKPPRGKRLTKHSLLIAASSIPVFWYMLFDKTSLVLGPTKNDSESAYLYLTTTAADGLARADRRWRTASAIIGSHLVPLFQTWLSFVREHSLGYLHCETVEWSWMFDTHEAFEEELRTCLRAVGHSLKQARHESRGPAAEWRHLLGQAHVGSHHGDLDPLGNLSYCGFSANAEVPWAEEEMRLAA